MPFKKKERKQSFLLSNYLLNTYCVSRIALSKDNIQACPQAAPWCLGQQGHQAQCNKVLMKTWHGGCGSTSDWACTSRGDFIPKPTEPSTREERFPRGKWRKDIPHKGNSKIAWTTVWRWERVAGELLSSSSFLLELEQREQHKAPAGDEAAEASRCPGISTPTVPPYWVWTLSRRPWTATEWLSRG